MKISHPRNREPLAITGSAVICALGSERTQVLEALKLQKAHPRVVTTRIGDEAWPAFRVFRARGHESFHPQDPEVDRCLEEFEMEDDPDLKFLIQVSERALREARIEPRSALASQTALIVIDEAPGVARLVKHMLESLSTFEPDQTTLQRAEALYGNLHHAVFHLQGFTYPFYLSCIFGLKRVRTYANYACASGLYALEIAHWLLSAGEAQRVLIAAVEYPSYYPKMRWFEERGLLSREGLVRPYSQARDGFLLGEGAAAIVVEPAATVTDRGAKPWGFYLAGAMEEETWKLSLPDVTSGVYLRAMTRALERAGIAAREISAVVPHGTATAIGDRYEAEALYELFGGAHRVPLACALKPQIGHTLGASALLETVLALWALEEGFLPGTRAAFPLDDRCALPLSADAVAVAPGYILKTANGFGGFDAAAVLAHPQVFRARGHPVLS